MSHGCCHEKKSSQPLPAPCSKGRTIYDSDDGRHHTDAHLALTLLLFIVEVLPKKSLVIQLEYPKMKTGVAFAFLGAVSSVAAHATFQEFWVNNVDEDQKCIRLPVSSVDRASVRYLKPAKKSRRQATVPSPM